MNLKQAKNYLVTEAGKGRSALSPKGQLSLGDIGPIAISLGVAIIIISVVTMILDNMKANVNSTEASNVLDKGIQAMGTFGDWFSIITIVAVAAIILGLVMLFRGSFAGPARE